jgi:hypothetical protein
MKNILFQILCQRTTFWRKPEQAKILLNSIFKFQLKYYYLVAYLLPIIIPAGFATFCYFFEDSDFLFDTWVIVAKQRSIPGFHFALRTEDFMRTFGLFEIVIKMLTLGFFLGSIFYFWKSDQELRSVDVQVHRPRESNWNKY